MTKTISTRQTPANIAAVLAILSTTSAHLERLSAGLTDNQLHTPLAPGERTFTENLAHLINTEARSSETIYLALLLDEPLIPQVHPERDRGSLLRVERLPCPDLLSYFRIRRQMLLPVLEALNEAGWSRMIREATKQRQESVYWQARALALHELEHLTDLETRLSAGFRDQGKL